MGTPATIAIQNADGSIESTEVNYDGYISYVGVTLQKNYTTEDIVRHLISIGSLSSLGEIIGEEHPFDSRTPEHEKMCRYYHRDRGEDWSHCKPKRHPTRSQFLRDADNYYIYLFTDGEWVVYQGEERSLLSQRIVNMSEDD